MGNTNKASKADLGKGIIGVSGLFHSARMQIHGCLFLSSVPRGVPPFMGALYRFKSAKSTAKTDKIHSYFRRIFVNSVNSARLGRARALRCAERRSLISESGGWMTPAAREAIKNHEMRDTARNRGKERTTMKLYAFKMAKSEYSYYYFMKVSFAGLFRASLSSAQGVLNF